jgi:uncharacterized protein
VPQDEAQGVKWVRKAADQDFTDAQFALGLLYDQGQGVTQDYAAAVNWYRKAADQGNAEGEALLGGMYYLGHGVPQDYVAAHMWSNLAAAGGDKKAAEFRDSVAKEMTPAQIAEAQKLAREWKPAKQPTR